VSEDDPPPAPRTDTRLREHNRGIIAYLSGAPHEPPEGCPDAEGWQRGYASARAAMGGQTGEARDG
jgi:hypothetical protein